MILGLPLQIKGLLPVLYGLIKFTFYNTSCHLQNQVTTFAKISMSFSLTSAQGAAVLTAHATFTKMLLSFTYRTYQFLEWDSKRKARVASNFHLEEFQKAQVNETEDTALFVAAFLFLSAQGEETHETTSQAATLAVLGQIGYVWTRTAIGYPKFPTITFAVIRYGGLFLAASGLWAVAFP